ncbi:hypothetical protein PM082_024599 [Marasmius tenuissimus]|nr:hypothetical protein PM082_024599 [Marasmius tenuissimus]
MLNTQTVGRGTQNNNNANGTQEIYETNYHYIQSVKSLQELLITHPGIGTSHTAERQHSLGRCLEGTGVEVLKEIREWGSSAGEDYPICSVRGPVGVGKSAIAMSICEVWEKEGRPFISFFVQSDAEHNSTVSELILTLARGLPTTPSARRAIQKRLSEDPDILVANLERQFEKLILVPTMNRSWGEWLWCQLSTTQEVPTIIVIDGLDGCGESEGKRFLKTIGTAFHKHPRFPLRFLITSRSESYIRDAFKSPPLCHKTKTIALDGNADIRRYFKHHLQEIGNRSQYQNAPFRAGPWPPVNALDDLVKQSCGQFAYASSVVSYIGSGNPPERLTAILSRQILGPQSPFRNLDLRYRDILNNHPEHEKILSILSAIIILPPHLSSSVACIELTLGLYWGEADTMLRAMHSIRIREDEIQVLHSFKDYLIDENRSGPEFYIKVPAQEHVLARHWLQNLSASRTRAYLSDGRLIEATIPFFTEWIGFCTSKCEPTQYLLDELENIDLVFVFFCGHILPRLGSGLAGLKSLSLNWNQTFSGLVVWMERNDDFERRAHLITRLSRPPERFHLELSPGVSIEDHAVQRAVLLATGYTKEPCPTSPADPARLCQVSFRLADCRCDPGSELQDPAHVACQEACMRIVPAVVGGKHSGANSELCGVFEDLVDSSLLQNCLLNSDLLSLCRAFFEVVTSDPPLLKMSSEEAEKRKQKLLNLIKSFPKGFDQEAKALEIQLCSLLAPFRQEASAVEPG